MKRIFLDFETYFDKVYSLRNMTPLEYVLDNRFEMLGCGLAVDDEPPRFMPQEKVIDYLRAVNEPYACITHNALFDAVILAWRYSIHPTILIDTLGMARALLANKTKQARVSLAAVLEYLGLEEKLQTINEMPGKHFTDLIADRDLLLRFNTYTVRDVRGCREIFNRLIDDFPAAELRIMDRLIRMATMPQLLLDEMNLKIYHTQIIMTKRNLMMQLGHDRENYMSNPKFAELLRQANVEPPMKRSTKTGIMTYAFAKTDDEFMELREHPDLLVQSLMAIRLGVKSTIEETRTQSFLNIARLTASRYEHSWLPVPLKFSGAHTHRFSGDWKLNMQNLSNRKTKVLRSSIRAPHGMTILAVDASQIEARLTAYLAGQENLLEQFSNPANDVYAWFGSQVLGYTITKKTHPVERFTFKTIVLALGFGMSAARLLFTLRNAANENNIQVEYKLEQCIGWVSAYRTMFDRIPALWEMFNWVINHMLDPTQPKPKLRVGEIDGTTIILPSRLRLYYNDIKWDGEETKYRFGSSWRKIYGAKMTENIVQALDRQHVMEANIRTEDRCAALGKPDVRLAMQEHDANVYVVEDKSVELVSAIMLEEMVRPPKWAPDIPLAAEVKCGPTYGALE